MEFSAGTGAVAVSGPGAAVAVAGAMSGPTDVVGVGSGADLVSGASA